MTAIVESEVRSYVGSRERKQYGDRFLTGRIEYINDLRLPGTVHMAVLRSPHAHARIVSVDLDRARQAPGVVAALSGAEAAELCGPIPHFIDPSSSAARRATCVCWRWRR